MKQIHPYNPDMSYHFVNMALTAEIQPLWEADENDNADIENLFAIPRAYYDKIFVASDLTADALYNDIQDYVQKHYEQIGVIRVGVDVIPDYREIDENWAISDVERFEQIYKVIESYSRRWTEDLSNTVRYSFSRMLMGYALRSKVDGHGIFVIRGTFSTEEWMNNINYRLVPFHPLNPDYGSVHNGFRDIYKGIRGQYRRLIDQIEPDKPIYLIGHSLGGAVSQLAALDISIKNPARADKIQAYIYAAPRTGNKAFAEAYDRLVGTSYRVVNVCDVVPYIPFDKLGDVLDTEPYDYWDTKGELSYIHQAGNPIANHMGSYHEAMRLRVPGKMDVSTPYRIE